MRALSAGNARMPLCRFDAKARLEALQKLSGECNFRHQNQRLPPRSQSFSNRFEIHLCLTGNRSPSTSETENAASRTVAQRAVAIASCPSTGWPLRNPRLVAAQPG